MAGRGMLEDANKRGIDVTRVATISTTSFPSSSSTTSSTSSSTSSSSTSTSKGTSHDNMGTFHVPDTSDDHSVATATYSAIHNEQGDLIAAVADVAVLQHLVMTT